MRSLHFANKQERSQALIIITISIMKKINTFMVAFSAIFHCFGFSLNGIYCFTMEIKCIKKIKTGMNLYKSAFCVFGFPVVFAPSSLSF